jgi:hypothetical protein
VTASLREAVTSLSPATSSRREAISSLREAIASPQEEVFPRREAINSPQQKGAFSRGNPGTRVKDVYFPEDQVRTAGEKIRNARQAVRSMSSLVAPRSDVLTADGDHIGGNSSLSAFASVSERETEALALHGSTQVRQPRDQIKLLKSAGFSRRIGFY